MITKLKLSKLTELVSQVKKKHALLIFSDANQEPGPGNQSGNSSSDRLSCSFYPLFYSSHRLFRGSYFQFLNCFHGNLSVRHLAVGSLLNL
jgi:hypothetical protein